MNLHGRSALDPRWTKHHRQVVADFMLATIKVIRKVPKQRLQYNQITGEYEGTAMITVWEGKARLQPFGQMGDMVVGQDTTSRRLMRVQIDDLETGINQDDMLLVTESPDSPELTTFTFEIRGSTPSSNAWVTDLVCEADTKRRV